MRKKILLLPLSLGLSTPILAREFVFTPTLETALVVQEATGDRFNNNDQVDAQSLSLLPGLVAAYKSQRLNASWTASHNHLQRSVNDRHQTDNYTNYNYAADLVLIENILQVRAKGRLGYQNILSSNYLINDPLLGGEDLSKTRTNTASVSLQLPQNPFFGLRTSASYATVDSEKRTDSSANLNNNSLSVSSDLYQGKNWDRVNWHLTSSFQQTERSQFEDFKSRQVNANVNIGLFADIAFTVTARHEANQGVTARFNTNGLLRDYNSYGVGLSYRQSSNRYLTLTYNEGDQSNQNPQANEDDKESFVGVDLQWSFTNRTSIKGNYGRRFYGESGSFALNHATKHLRTRIVYREDLTTFTRLVSQPGIRGVFVCQGDGSSISNCFQPNTLLYELQPGEQFVQLNQQVSEISDEVILRKRLSGQIGFERRRLSLSLDGQYSTSDYVESGRQQRTYTVGSNAALQLGARTRLKAAINYAITDERNRANNNGESKTWVTSTGITRDISKKLKLDFDLRYIDRQANIDQGDLRERRYSMTLRYDFN